MSRHELIMAPAGAGKTTLIAKTINELLDSGVPKDKILCITFTNLACRNMRKSVNDGVKVSTIHSLIFHTVVKKEKYSIADDSCEQIVLQNILMDDGFNEVSAANMCYKYLNMIKKYSLMCLYLTKDKTYADYKSLIDSREMNEYFMSRVKESKGCNLANIGKYYKELLLYYEDNRLIDFSTLILRGIFECRLDVYYVFVDEYQDILYQEYLAAIGVNSGATIRLYGDLNQSIYEWRGVDSNYIMRQFKKQFNPKEIYLDTIYRSQSKIVELGNSLLSCDTSNYNYVKSGGLTSSTVYDNIHEEVSSVLSQAMSDVALGKRVAILSRSNDNIKPYIDKCREHKVSFHSKTSSAYRSDPCVNVCLQLLCLRAEQFNDSRFHNILYSEILLRHSNIRSSELNALNIRQYPIQLFTIGSKYYDPLVDKKFRQHTTVVFDVETTGLEVGVDRIIQISGIKLDRDFNVIGEVDIIINPDKSVGDSEKTHHFSDEFLRTNGVSSVEGLGKFLEFIGDSYMLGHNVNYDKSMLETECKRVGLNLKDMTYYDSLSISRFVLDCDSYKLGDLINYLGIDANPNHNAIEDVRATVKLIMVLIDKLKICLNAFELSFDPSDGLLKYINYIRDMVSACLTCDIRDTFRVANRFLSGMGISHTDRWRIVNINDNMLQMLATSPDLDDYTLYAEFQLSSMPTSIDRPLSILTVHQSKGLEWDCVYLVGCNVRYSQSQEDLRVEYVATTRAKEKFCVSCIDSGNFARIVGVVRGEL